MSFFTMLYNLLIGPLELLFEILFAIANRVINNPGLSIIVLSLAMNFLVLPLYRRADAMQEEERQTEARLHDWVSHIKKTFKGDERYMMLQTYYRENHYKPYYALRGTVSLLLEIPFFIAAYNMLSGLSLLQGVSFGPIRDLGVPDAMIAVGSMRINALPVLMTAINLVTSALYTKGLPAKSKIQLYGMALIFLVLLYDSPSGLVFYWTLNNVFSLIKTIFYKLKNPKLVFSAGASAISAAILLAIVILHPQISMHRLAEILILAVCLNLPMISYLLKKKNRMMTVPQAGKKENTLFLCGSLFLTVLTGLVIPSAVISASPEEFINFVTLTNPLMYVLNSAIIAAGIFLVWFGIFYKLATPSGKTLMSLGTLILSAVFLVDYMFFGTDYGVLSPELKYDIFPDFSARIKMVNLAVLAVLAIILVLIWKFRKQLLKPCYTVLCLVLALMSLYNVFNIHKTVSGKIDEIQGPLAAEVSIPLNKNGKNVVVIMMDRAVGSYLPYIMQEKPELKEQFKGFTYYPNTISYGGFTNIGLPGVFGGYEYTPEETNRRDSVPLEEKHNEALKVMPVLFDENGYHVTVCDPTYAGYDWIPDLNIYEDYPDIHTYITMTSDNEDIQQQEVHAERLMYRNLFCYSLFKASPVVLQPAIYSGGTYNSVSSLDPEGESSDTQVISGDTTAVGYPHGLLTSYNVLRDLPGMTKIGDSDENTFMMICNETTHAPALLQQPEYEPVYSVDNTEFMEQHRDSYIVEGRKLTMEGPWQVTHYHCNVAAMLQLGRWMDYLRKNDIYDNTRIIIVADHGQNLEQIREMQFGQGDGEDAMFFNPLLMYKDFGSSEYTVDMQFMTNADVPSLAFKDLIDKPVNPFTGNPINSDVKNRPEQHILLSYDWDVAINNGNTYLPGKWIGLENHNIFDMDNWHVIGETLN